MKKSIFLLGVAVAAMTSCSNDKLLDQAEPIQRAIGFESFVNKTTKAITTTDNPTAEAGLRRFYVHGYYGTTDVFNGKEVTKTIDNNQIKSWDYQLANGEQQPYWTNNDYYFAAYAQGNDETSINGVQYSSINSKATLSIPFTAEYTTSENAVTICNVKDLVADLKTETGLISRTAAVDFSFKHLLAKIKFTIKNNSPENLPMTITNLVINGVKINGTFTSTNTDNWVPNQSDWEVSGDAMTNFIPILESANQIVKDGTVVSEDYLVIPQEFGETIKYSFTATFYDNKGSIVSVVPFDNKFTINKNQITHTAWEPNTYYNYVIGVPSSVNPIKFNVTSVFGWGDPTVITLN